MDPVVVAVVCGFCRNAEEHLLVAGRALTRCRKCRSNNLIDPATGEFVGPPQDGFL
ncbi:hypothetical protein [Desertimonas flava]|uniref:hypothetical protein n=1 Tax=Desertimonas flava TaxID=2064846 RepID=UPI0013C48849|nr:hypothetical protein [Desertimonas flava]